MKKGRVVRLPSDKESERAKENNLNVYFPAIGRYFTSKTGKIMLTLNMIPDACFMLSEDKPKESQVPDDDF